MGNAKHTGKVSPSIISKSLEQSMYLGLDGIPVEIIPTDHTDFLLYNTTGYWSFPNQTIIHSLESQYLLLYEPPRDCRRLNILREYDNEKTNLHS